MTPEDSVLREVAEMIILDHALDMEDMTDDEQDEVWDKLSKLISLANVTVEFPGSINATSS
jgi:hypothetical protein